MRWPWTGERCRSRPRCNANSASTATWLVNALVDATPTSGPACRYTPPSASRAMLLPPGSEGADALPIAADAVEVHTDVPEGPAGRTVRLADSSSSGWHATLDGEPLTLERPHAADAVHVALDVVPAERLARAERRLEVDL